MSGQKVGMMDCSCGGKAAVSENGKGSLSSSCASCGSQAFAKTPRAVAAWRGKITNPGGAASAPAAAGSSWGSFDMGKL